VGQVLGLGLVGQVLGLALALRLFVLENFKDMQLKLQYKIMFELTQFFVVFFLLGRQFQANIGITVVQPLTVGEILLALYYISMFIYLEK